MKFNKKKITPTDQYWPEGVYMIQKDGPDFGKECLILKEGRDNDVYEYLTTYDYDTE